MDEGEDTDGEETGGEGGGKAGVGREAETVGRAVIQPVSLVTRAQVRKRSLRTESELNVIQLKELDHPAQKGHQLNATILIKPQAQNLQTLKLTLKTLRLNRRAQTNHQAKGQLTSTNPTTSREKASRERSRRAVENPPRVREQEERVVHTVERADIDREECDYYGEQ
jgi:hypothetical protein